MIIVGRFKGDRRGQFVILASVMIAAFMFSLILTIGQMSASRLEVPYEPVDELILTITSDFERCLTGALAAATQKYSETWNESLAESVGNAVIGGWHKALLEAYSGLGLDLPLDVARNIDWMIDWGSVRGSSSVSTSLRVGVEAYALRNLVVIMKKAIHLKILNAAFNAANRSMTIEFEIYLTGGREKSVAVSDLTETNVLLLANNTVNIRDKYEVRDFKYLGSGRYLLMAKLDPIVAENIVLLVTTNEGIRVAAKTGISISGAPEGGGGNGGAPGDGGVSEEWRVIYLAPLYEKGVLRKEEFSLVLDIVDEQDITPRLNNPLDSRTGKAVKTTPYNLTLGETVTIILWARYSKQGNIEVSVRLGYISSDGRYVEIGGGTITVVKSTEYRKYEITFSPSVNSVPKGSIFVLTLRRMDNNSGGTLQIDCGPGKSRIILW